MANRHQRHGSRVPCLRSQFVNLQTGRRKVFVRRESNRSRKSASRNESLKADRSRLKHIESIMFYRGKLYRKYVKCQVGFGLRSCGKSVEKKGALILENDANKYNTKGRQRLQFFLTSRIICDFAKRRGTLKR